jgi:two-component system chemotaxis response regulator CheB
MRQRVSISSASPFLALVVRKTLARSRHLELSSDHRDTGAARAALREEASLAIVDAELLRGGTEGGALASELALRRAPSVVIDARGSGVSDEVAASPSVVVVRGRHGQELDVGVIETELLAAVGSALRRRGSLRSEASEAPNAPSPSLARAELYDAPLDLVVLGVSTGGPPLLLELLARLTVPAIPMLIVQHMPESETAGFAARLSESSGLLVREVAGGPLPPIGGIGVVRGGSDFRVVRRAGDLHLRGATIAGNPFHPNVDEILTSAVAAGVAVGAAILTGMGQDGAAGALAMARKGLPVIAQRPDTCAVAGMPQAVIDGGAARWVQSPEGIASTLNGWSEAARRGAPSGGTKCLP